jgi:hypothetical protein
MFGPAIDTRIRRGGGWDSSLGADAALPPEPSDGMVVVTTLGWLAVGGVVGAALWALGEEILGVHRGQR